MKTIHVDFAPDGGIKIEAVGFTGADCDQATRFLEDALGTVTGKARKPEYHQAQQTRPRQQLGRKN